MISKQYFINIENLLKYKQIIINKRFLTCGIHHFQSKGTGNIEVLIIAEYTLYTYTKLMFAQFAKQKKGGI